MTGADYLAAAAALFSAFTFERLLPSVVLAVLFGMFIYVLAMAQRRADFDVSYFLREQNGKPSSQRLFAFIALSIHVWYITIQTINGKIEKEEVIQFAMLWSGVLVVLQGLMIMKGSPPEPPPPLKEPTP